MKPFDYYSKLQTLYPNKKDYITLYVYDKGACIYSESSLSNTKSNLKEDYPNAIMTHTRHIANNMMMKVLNFIKSSRMICLKIMV